jgi:hypothetical protein
MPIEPCSICRKSTYYSCPACMMDRAERVLICANSKCQHEHADKFCSQKIPRRSYLNKMIPAERAIRAAILSVERLEADERLTEAIVLLGKAMNKVADFVDKVNV